MLYTPLYKHIEYYDTHWTTVNTLVIDNIHIDEGNIQTNGNEDIETSNYWIYMHIAQVLHNTHIKQSNTHRHLYVATHIMPDILIYCTIVL